MPTFAGQTITSGQIRTFEQGDWLADVATNSAARIPDGTRVTLEVETLKRSGAIIRGGISGDVGRYLVSGRPEWDKPLPARARNAYRSSASVLLQNVLSDILQDVFGPSWQSLVVLPPASRLGEHYERPGTRGDVSITGRELLALLKLPWYVRDDGVTVFAAREGGLVKPADTPLISYRNDALGLRVIATEDPGAFIPGKTFEGEIIGEVVHSITPEDITTYTWPRKTSNAFADAVKAVVWRMFPRMFFQGVHEYVTIGASSNGKHDLQSVGSRWLPDVKLASFWTGAAGHRALLPPGMRVGVAFMNGDPAKPILVHVEPLVTRDAGYTRAPDIALFYASDRIEIDADTTVKLGGATPVVVNSGSLQTYFADLQVATGVPVPVGYTAAKAKA